MTTTFYLIRHGERDTPPDFLPGRSEGIRLTPRGREQAERLAQRLAAVRIDRIVSSPLERALETAAPLSREKNVPIEANPSFVEMDFGAWTGKRVAALEGDEHWRRFNLFRSDVRIPDGESALEVQRRFVAGLLHLHGVVGTGTVACFSHADPIRFALIHFLGMSLDHFARLEISVGSLSRLEIDEWGARLTALNEVPLP